MVPIILLLDLMMLFFTCSITYNNNLNIFKRQIKNAAEMAVKFSESFNLEDDESAEQIALDYTEICEMFDVTYVFVLDPDIQNNSETYLAIGFGENASEDAKKTRYRGVKVDGTLNQQQINAYNGDTDAEPLHETNQFDDSLVCYLPCTQYLDADQLEYVDYDHPILVGAEISLNSVNKSFIRQFIIITILTFSLTLLIVAAFAVILYFKVTKPVRRISQRMDGFITDREKGFEKLEVKGRDEFAQMSLAFNTMTEEIDRYINDIDKLNKEKHTQEAEMNIARRIQMGLLLPEHCENKRYDLNAFIKPAKDVGGDYYDYFRMADGRIFAAIADVSGKGISAALFMTRAITLLHQYAIADYGPSRILKEYNHTLCLRNPGDLFITTFVVIYDPETGILTYSNAGHNFPYILSDHTVIPLKKAHGTAAGLFDGEEYEDESIPVAPGSVLFMFTDGVNEAKNNQNAFYSTERLEKKLTECSKAGSTDVLNDVRSDLKSFVRGAEQNDDITMLTLYFKPRPDEIVLHLTSDLQKLPDVKKAIFELDVSEDLKRTIFLAAEEIFVNICSYAYDSPGEVDLRIASEDDGVALTFIDSGKPFDPTSGVIEIEDYDHENSIGGLGRYLAFSVAERYRYEYSDNKNILFLYFSKGEDDDDHKKA